MLGQCALALGVAHEAKVVHRDVKPANILIRADGLVKLTDFGIARAADASGHTRAGDLLGTPSYLSPEQALGRPATGASDLYALGVVGHEMLSGTKPFDKPTPIATAMSHIHEAPPPLPDDVPEVLAGVIEDLLAKDPLDRPDNARAVAYRLGPCRPGDGRLGDRPRPRRVRRVDTERRHSGHRHRFAAVRSLRRRSSSMRRHCSRTEDSSSERVTASAPRNRAWAGRDVDDVTLQPLHEATVVADAATHEEDRVLLPVADR